LANKGRNGHGCDGSLAREAGQEQGAAGSVVMMPASSDIGAVAMAGRLSK